MNSSKPKYSGMVTPKLPAGTATVQLSSDKNSPVIAYLDSGCQNKTRQGTGVWGWIEVMDGGKGFIPLEYPCVPPRRKIKNRIRSLS